MCIHTLVIVNVQKMTKYSNKHTQVFCLQISLYLDQARHHSILSVLLHLHIHSTTRGIYFLSPPTVRNRYIVFVPGESYFGYIADAFLRAELAPPPNTLPALVNAVSSWLSHISPRRRARTAQIQRCRRAPDSLGLSERSVR